jgi:hypothetical protein
MRSTHSIDAIGERRRATWALLERMDALLSTLDAPPPSAQDSEPNTALVATAARP